MWAVRGSGWLFVGRGLAPAGGFANGEATSPDRAISPPPPPFDISEKRKNGVSIPTRHFFILSRRYCNGRSADRDWC